MFFVLFCFLPGVDASHVYVRAWALGCFQSYPNLSEGADRVGGQLRGDKECPFSGVTNSGRVWRRVPESDARSVQCHFMQSHTRMVCVFSCNLAAIFTVGSMTGIFYVLLR